MKNHPNNFLGKNKINIKTKRNITQPSDKLEIIFSSLYFCFFVLIFLGFFSITFLIYGYLCCLV